MINFIMDAAFKMSAYSTEGEKVVFRIQGPLHYDPIDFSILSSSDLLYDPFPTARLRPYVNDFYHYGDLC